MRHKKTFTVFSSLVGLIVLGVTFSEVSPSKDRNLKVLPKDISDAKLDSIMQTYNIALGVKCNFCHLPMKGIGIGIADSLDYAADGEPMKEDARKMMRMTIEINKTNFWFDKKERPEYLHTVTCKTCHRGEAYPED